MVRVRPLLVYVSGHVVWDSYAGCVLDALDKGWFSLESSLKDVVRSQILSESVLERVFERSGCVERSYWVPGWGSCVGSSLGVFDLCGLVSEMVKHTRYCVHHDVHFWEILGERFENSDLEIWTLGYSEMRISLSRGVSGRSSKRGVAIFRP